MCTAGGNGRPRNTLVWVVCCAALLALCQGSFAGEPASLIKDINTNPGAGSKPSWLIAVGGTVFFVADDGTGAALWKSDGTGTGTMLVKSGITDLSNAADVNGTLFFGYDDGTNGRELWKSDGTPAGTVMVKDIYPGANGSGPWLLTNVAGTLYFTADDGTNGNELWTSDGTLAGTVMVKDIYVGTFGSHPSYLVDFGGTLYFTANDGLNGTELWKSDGTPAGTVMVQDIYVGGNGSIQSPLKNVAGTLYFSADDGTNGAELWKYDGVSATLVKDIRAGTTGSNPSDLTNVAGTLFFAADDGVAGNELWKSAGTAGGTVMVMDISPGPAGAGPYSLTASGGRLYFLVDVDVAGTYVSQLWTSDGTDTGTVLLHNGPVGWDMADVGGTLLFTAYDPEHDRELWKSDGTPAGTVLVQDFSIDGSSNPKWFTILGSSVLFSASDGLSGSELWGMSMSNLTLPCITSPSKAFGTVGSAFSFPVTASDGPSTFSASPLPDGLVCDPSGLIHGTPTTEGVTSTTLTVTNATGDRTGTLVFIISAAAPVPPMINTFAGIGTSEPYTEGGSALSSGIWTPAGLAADAAGNLYVADTCNNAVRKVDTAGNITTAAGNGTRGYPGGLSPLIKLKFGVFGGDGGAATAASLNLPTGLAIDAAGNLYIADTGNHRIRKVAAADGKISTVAGNGTVVVGPMGLPLGDFGGDNGPATAAQLNSPMGVAVDASGNVFIADTGNHRIRKVDSGGTITTVAGDGATIPGLLNFQYGDFKGDGGAATAASLNGPMGVAVDAAGNLYIADTVNQRIRKVDGAGTITTVAGIGTTVVGILDLPFGTFDLAAGNATSIALNQPSAVAVDGGGTLYIADCANHRVRRVNLATGALDTLAGNSPGFAGDGGPADISLLRYPVSVARGNSGLFVADMKNKRVRKIGPLPPVITSPLTAKGTVGAAFTYTITATDSPTSYNATPLPAGLSVNTSKGAITGTPSVAGTTQVTISASNAVGTGSATLTITIDPAVTPPTSNQPPTINSLSATVGGASVDTVMTGTAVTFTASASDPENDPLTISWDFGGLAKQMGNPTTYTFTTAGTFTITATANDGKLDSAPVSMQITVLAPSSGGAGVTNVSNGETVANPLNGITIQVASSNGGVIELLIDINAMIKEAYYASTDFTDVPTRGSTGVKGLRPVHQFVKTGVFVATSNAMETASGQSKGKARKTLAISRKETGEEQFVTGDSTSPVITPKSLKGKFIFTKPATSRPVSDLVSFSGTFTLAPGLDLSKAQDIALGIGNITDTSMVDPKGKGTVPGTEGRIKKLRVKYPKLKGTTITTGGETARFDVTLSMADMSPAGFDTEGVTPEATDLNTKNTAPRSIQVALVLAGVSYEVPAPVSFKFVKSPYTRVWFGLDDGAERLVFRDARTFGRVWSGPADALDALPALAYLGPEPLNIDREAFAQRLRARHGRLKSLLLNQRFVAGIGNIYADEALFAAGLHPLARADSVPRRRAFALHAAIRRVLAAAIRAGGTSISDFLHPDGQPGWFSRQLRVYGREGEPCPRCCGAVKRIVVGQRGTWFCPRCQRRRVKS
ncbi:MAG: putative Ig domain-containing protein [Planctomycetota bacterium]|nr:putative Ig domain-containing protein [Planctomycetota bacterium]